MILKRLFYFIAECLSTFNQGIESYSDRGKRQPHDEQNGKLLLVPNATFSIAT